MSGMSLVSAIRKVVVRVYIVVQLQLAAKVHIHIHVIKVKILYHRRMGSLLVFVVIYSRSVLAGQRDWVRALDTVV